TWLVYLSWGAIEFFTRAKKKQLIVSPRQRYWLLGAVFLPIVIYAISLFLATLFSQDYLEWTKILLLPLPVVLAYLILRERLLDIRVVIKRSAIYAILSTALIGTFVVLVLAISELVALLTGQHSIWANFAAALITVVVFNLYRQKTQDYLDRRFFKYRHNYQKALLEFSKDLGRLEELETLLAKISKQFAETLHLSNCLPFIQDQRAGAYIMVAPHGLSDAAPQQVIFLSAQFGLSELLVQEKRPLELYGLDTDPLYKHLSVAEKTYLRKVGTALAVPLLVKEKLVGMLLLGNKKSGDYFNLEDVDFFATLSTPLAVAVENARLHKEQLEMCRMEEELRVARGIQANLISRELPKFPGIDLATTYHPSRQVSGDIYSVTRVTHDQLALAIGDASGKGVPASLLMATVQSSLRTLCLECFPPADIISRLNQLVYEGTDPENFVTFFYGVYDQTTKQLSYVNAGHHPPLYFSPDGEPQELSEGGLVLGIFPERGYQTGTLPVKPNSLIFLYTDGVVEAENDFEEHFGRQRLIETILQYRVLPAENLSQKVLNALREFCGGRELVDDVSLVILKIE
ncbi:MAG: GAF domain-containing SpoIIE family protein phosphatase, partial [Candidatus Zixiibacteriota bacterium]